MRLDVTWCSPQSHFCFGRQGLDRSLHLSLRPLEGSYACASVTSSHAARCPNRALGEVNDAVRKRCGRTLWMTSCSFERGEGDRLARRSSRTTPATESQLVYPVPGTEEHRCTVFTHRADWRGGRLSVTTMSAATASITDVSRTDFTNTGDSPGRNKAGKTD